MNKTTLNLLHDLEKTQKQYWNIAPETGNFISMIIKMQRPETVLEIGTSNGYSALWIADALKSNNNGAHLYTIEFWEQRRSIAVSYFEKAGLSPFITSLQGKALDVLKNFSAVPDLVFLDANKEQYLDYFKTLEPKLKAGSIILADNVLSHENKVKPFVDEISSRSNWQVEILPLPAGLLFGLKI